MSENLYDEYFREARAFESGYYKGYKVWEDKIRNKIRKLNFEKILTETIQPSKQSYNYAIEVLEDLLKEKK